MAMDADDQQEAEKRSFLHPVFLKQFGGSVAKVFAVAVVGWGVFALATYGFRERPALKEGELVLQRVEEFKHANLELPASLGDLKFLPANHWQYSKRADGTYSISKDVGWVDAFGSILTSLNYDSDPSRRPSGWYWQSVNGDTKQILK